MASSSGAEDRSEKEAGAAVKGRTGAQDHADAKFPLLSNSHAKAAENEIFRHNGETTGLDKGEDAATAKSFERSVSPTTTLLRNKGAEYGKVGEDGLCRMHRFTLYETATRFYIVGVDVSDQKFRVLKIDRTADSGELSVSEDDIIYTKVEMDQLLNAIDDGNRASGGLKLRCTMWGLLGFIRFTGPFYMLLVTKRSSVAMIGGHYIYQIDGTELVSLTPSSSTRFKLDRNPEEARFVAILNNLDLSRSFYFSHSYDITRTLQHNIARERSSLSRDKTVGDEGGFNSMFVWNDYLLEPALKHLRNTYDWCLRIVHGYVDQATLSVYGRSIYVTIMARRSRYFAGARFLKRGANDLGYVANDVETEQIVSEMVTTSFHAPGPKLYGNPNYSSYVQHRGSIPLCWTQDNTGVNPKPPIELQVDPFFSAAALHFDDLFERYGAPVYALNLVKSREKVPRESKLLTEYTNAIRYLNQSLPEGKKIIYKAWDMSRASKSRDQDVIRTLEDIAEEIVKRTGFFQSGDNETVEGMMQNGVARTNCIDCLDRTNAAQFVIGKCALGHQLHALGIIDHPSVDYDTDAVNLFSHMYHDHGDTIAVQYGGSHLVNTMETYRKINQWTSHSRDMVESFKRYYNNSFLDGQRQEAYNLFLGNYIFARGQPMLWDLSTDYYLHHANPSAWAQKLRRSYVDWYTPEHLVERELPPIQNGKGSSGLQLAPRYFDDFWIEYYRPFSLSVLEKSFPYRLNSTIKYIPLKFTQEGRYDLSPFKVRVASEHEAAEKKRARKGVTILAPHDKEKAKPSGERDTSTQGDSQSARSPNVRSSEYQGAIHGIMKEKTQTDSAIQAAQESRKGMKIFHPPSELSQSTLKSLDPTVNKSETDGYESYLRNSQDVSLLILEDMPTNTYGDYLKYSQGISADELSAPFDVEEDAATYEHYLEVKENPLTVSEADAPMKRYKAYKRWLKGKPLIK